MFNALKARWIQGYRTGAFPPEPPHLPPDFQGRPSVDASRCDGCGACCGVCPTGAAERTEKGVEIDIGKCIFCGACAAACPREALRFTAEYRLAAMSRERLRHGAEPEYSPERQLNRELVRLCGRTLKIRQVSAGGCAACELDFNVLNTLAWDMGRFGIQVVASPRHADCLLVTGPVTAHMRLALEKTYAAMPRPKWVIVSGACAISGGLYAESPEVLGGVDRLLGVDLYIPGCPPHPATVLEGLLRLLGREEGR